MKICFVFAMIAEAENLLKASTILEDRPLGLGHFYRFSFEGKEALACVAGVGKVCAAAAVAACAALYPEIDAFVNLGIGGSLNAEVAPLMSVVLSERFVQHDADTTSFGDAPGFLWTPALVYIPADKALTEVFQSVCADLGFASCLGTMASGDQFITKEEQKEIIISRFDALMIDMEAAAFAEIAYGYGKPIVAVRVVSDAVDHQKEYEEYKPHACKRICEIGAEFLRRVG